MGVFSVRDEEEVSDRVSEIRSAVSSENLEIEGTKNDGDGSI